MEKDCTVYCDERYVLGCEDSLAFIRINGEEYKLTCHPYEPCLYITGKNGSLTAVHNAFDPSYVLSAFSEGMTITSITGTEYDAPDFCRMVEYAAGMNDIQIDEAEKVFGKREKKKIPASQGKGKGTASGTEIPRPEYGRIIENDPVYDLTAKYPDSVTDWCLVKNEHSEKGYTAHRCALLWASRKLFLDENEEVILHFDVQKANARQINADSLFAPVGKDEKLNYRKAFLCPPHPNGYTDADFDKINRALFPNGTDKLEVFEWTTDWSEYFDEGNEWWGSLCLTVYDKSLDRFTVIMASATD